MTKEVSIPVSLTCSLSSDGFFRLAIRDEDAVNAGIEIKLTPEQLAHMLATRVVDGVTAEVRDPDKFGKKRVCESRTIECPIQYDRDVQKAWLIENGQEEGWEIDTYLGSQNSVSHADEKVVLRYQVKKWI